MRGTEGLGFDDAGSKVEDLALIRLRPGLVRHASDVAKQFDLLATQQLVLGGEEAALVVREGVWLRGSLSGCRAAARQSAQCAGISQQG